MKKTPIVVIGGTGASLVLQGLRSYPVQLTAIISTADSGGGSGQLREELGIIPVGDLRKCLLALGDFSPEEKNLWNYRFTEGSLRGQGMGNLILAGLIKQNINLKKALAQMAKIWKLGLHKILPITKNPTTLCAQYADKTIVCGEHLIDEPEKLRGEITKAYLKDELALHPAAAQAILRAKLIVFAPGDLYTNTIIPLLTKNGPEIFRRAKAPIVLVAPLMTSRGETDGFTLSRLVSKLEEYLFPKKIDIIITNTEPIPPLLLQRYRALEEIPLTIDFEQLPKNKKIIKAPLLNHGKIKKVKGDALRRSLLQHDPQKLARCVMKVIQVLS